MARRRRALGGGRRRQGGHPDRQPVAMGGTEAEVCQRCGKSGSPPPPQEGPPRRTVHAHGEETHRRRRPGPLTIRTAAATAGRHAAAATVAASLSRGKWWPVNRGSTPQLRRGTCRHARSRRQVGGGGRARDDRERGSRP